MSGDVLRWPKAADLNEALDVIDKLREVAKFQLDLGYWVTVSFPSKYHLNKILSTQYIDRDVLVRSYGPTMVDRLESCIPYIKIYLQFIGSKDDKAD